MQKTELDKFLFDVDFQDEILRYTLKDKNGYKALLLYKFEYFDLEDQKIIARAVHRFFKRTGRVPRSSALLNEELNGLFKTRDYAQAFLPKDRTAIKKKVTRLYKGILKEPDEILSKIKTFASYVEFKKVLEEVNLNDYNQYSTYLKKIQSAINVGMTINERQGLFIVNAAASRFIGRKASEDLIVPTRIRQMDKLTNAGGYARGSVIVVIDKPKKGKTLFLVNVARWFISKRSEKALAKNKRVIYFDLENGEQNISFRIDQAVAQANKLEVMQGKHDEKLRKIYRKLRRLGGEVYVKRLPAYSTTNDFQKVLDDIYSEYGIKFEVAVIDYMGLMGAVSGKKDDFERISDAYLDVKNWADHNELDMVFTGHHVKREAYNRRATRYRSDDLAKCIDIERHVDAIYGIQQNDTEEGAGIMRLELIVQRDGLPSGRAMFYVNLAHQKLVEFSTAQLHEYEETIGKDVRVEEESKPKRRIKTDFEE